MASVSDPNGFIEHLLSQQASHWLAAGGATLFIYDWLLCLDREVQYLWKARWSFGKVWFIIHRYAMMALVVGMVYEALEVA
ncbi:hypothetical protein FRC00_008801 [Tulasnella sp. 408]|nr:hypothetical protein FRC00_008801 [Tulasnella sp. 408]